MENSREDVEAGKLWALLSYLVPILVAVPLMKKDNEFSLFHARQALVLLIFGIPTCGGCIVGSLVFAVMGAMNAYNGKYEPLPLIGKFGEEWFGNIRKA